VKEEPSSRGEPDFGPSLRKDTLHAKRILGEVAVTGNACIRDWGNAIRYGSLGLIWWRGALPKAG
jgi:hypothetical protein